MLSPNLPIARLLFVVALVEFIYASAGVSVLLFARIKRVTLTANVNLNHISLFGGAGHEFGAASAFHRHFVVIGMYILFHSASFSFFNALARKAFAPQTLLKTLAYLF